MSIAGGPLRADNDPDTAATPPRFGPERFFNRELSWLAFNRRVMEEAAIRHTCCSNGCASCRFRAAISTNFSWSAWRAEGAAACRDRRSVGRRAFARPAAAEIEAEVNRLVDQQQSEWQRLHKLLADQGITVHGTGSDKEPLRAALRQYFIDQIFPILTPQVLDPAHPFPFIPNRGLGIIFDLERKATGETVRELVLIPAALPRFVPVPGQQQAFVPVEYLIELFGDLLFPGFTIRSLGVFRIIRDSDIELEEEAEDLVRLFAPRSAAVAAAASSCSNSRPTCPARSLKC